MSSFRKTYPDTCSYFTVWTSNHQSKKGSCTKNTPPPPSPKGESSNFNLPTSNSLFPKTVFPLMQCSAPITHNWWSKSFYTQTNQNVSTQDVSPGVESVTTPRHLCGWASICHHLLQKNVTSHSLRRLLNGFNWEKKLLNNETQCGSRTSVCAFTNKRETRYKVTLFLLLGFMNGAHCGPHLSACCWTQSVGSRVQVKLRPYQWSYCHKSEC